MLEVHRAKGIYLYDPSGKEYIDLISGVGVSYLGHNNPDVIRAVKNQIERHLHVMVYGEFIQSGQAGFAGLLCKNLDPGLNCVYFVNSGTEAVEGAMKLAKKYTGRSEVVSFTSAYHGSTHGSMSAMGGEQFKLKYRPLLPDIRFLNFNSLSDIDQISGKTACVIAEPVQAEAGVILQENGFLSRLKERCNRTGALLIFDEVQTGFGRTGEIFAYNLYHVVPDILILAKGLGGGMPLGAFISGKHIMKVLAMDPALGHITTFGGHPVSCAAGMAAFRILLREKTYRCVKEKELLFRKLLTHPAIKEIRGEGLLLAVEFGSAEILHRVFKHALKNRIITDWFLFCNTALRISPALTITGEEIQKACSLLMKSIDQALKSKI
jgi:acetylornithine/succinyldiaminopimelate/putrescine aminotransferase